ncbi:MAG TPA: hypothetical protein VGI39_00605 [Polyangiaceae bacterium]|jgi:hypothetical protein
MISGRFGGVALALVLACAPEAARAQSPSPGDDAPTALTLFEEGRRLVAEGKLEEACPKFLASQRIVPKVSTLLNLADCYEREGRLASAWARYTEAAATAQQAGQSDRETFAHERAKALEPQLPRLTLVAPRALPGRLVRRDGADVLDAALGTAVPVDAGPHVIEVSAPGKRPWSREITAVTAENTTVTLPELEDEPAIPATPAIAPPPLGVVAANTPAAPAERAPADRAWSPWRIAALGSVGAGVVGLGLGTGFALVAVGKKSDAEQQGCVGNLCPANAAPARDEARSDANIATAMLVAGGVLAAGGAALWFLAPRTTSTSVTVVPHAGTGGAGVDLFGRF